MLNQSVRPDEILVMDDASTDDSVEVVERIAREHPIVRLHRSEKNLGVVLNMNRGLELARGDYVFLSSADDQVGPGFFEKSLRLLAGHPQAALSCTIGDWHELDTGLKWHMGVGMADTPSYLSPARMVEVERRGRLYISPNSVIFRRAALIEVGKFVPELKYACDWFAMYVAGFRYGICFVPEPLAVFNISRESYYHRSRRQKEKHGQMVHDLLKHLLRPDFGDAVDRIRISGALYMFGWPVLQAVMTQPQYRWFLTPLYVRKALWHSLRIQIKRFTPTFLGNWYLRMAGYRTPSVNSP